tara:strand:+ start:590 stop:811 length:222 start_codon:yes stop_codon:yes gene_type:complete
MLNINLTTEQAMNVIKGMPSYNLEWVHGNKVIISNMSLKGKCRLYQMDIISPFDFDDLYTNKVTQVTILTESK